MAFNLSFLFINTEKFDFRYFFNFSIIYHEFLADLAGQFPKIKFKFCLVSLVFI